MNSQRLLKIFVGLCLVSCSVIVFLILRQRREIEDAKNEFAQRAATLNAEEGRLQMQLRTLYKQPEPRHAQITDQKSAASKLADFEQHRIAAGDNLRTAPEYTQTLIRNARRTVIRQFGDAIEALNLARDTSERLKALLVDKELAISDANLVAQRLGIGWNSPASDFQVQRKIANETEAGIRALLGDEGYAAWREQLDFQRLRKSMLDDCNVGLAERGVTPLNNEQLLACFRAHSHVRVTADHPTTQQEWAELIRPHIFPVMSPDQLEAYIDYSFSSVRKQALGASFAAKAMNARK